MVQGRDRGRIGFAAVHGRGGQRADDVPELPGGMQVAVGHVVQVGVRERDRQVRAHVTQPRRQVFRAFQPLPGTASDRVRGVAEFDRRRFAQEWGAAACQVCHFHLSNATSELTPLETAASILMAIMAAIH
ncbi:hypothetical protein GCM10020220_042870 [Nonomuraea rubra]